MQATTDMEEVFLSLGLDIIGLGVFNYDFNSITKESPVIKVLYGSTIAHFVLRYCALWVSLHLRHGALDGGLPSKAQGLCAGCVWRTKGGRAQIHLLHTLLEHPNHSLHCATPEEVPCRPGSDK